MANIHIRSHGFSVGRWRFPSFLLRDGECLTLCLPEVDQIDHDRIVACLTGVQPVPGLEVRSRIVFARPAAPVASWWQWFKHPTALDWLRSNTTLPDEAIQSFLRDHDLNQQLPLSHYAGSPRMLLGLLAAYAQTPSAIAFSTSGLDPMGVRAVFRIVGEHLPECSALYLAWPYYREGQKEHDIFPDSVSVTVHRHQPAPV